MLNTGTDDKKAVPFQYAAPLVHAYSKVPLHPLPPMALALSVTVVPVQTLIVFAVLLAVAEREGAEQEGVV